MFKLFKELRRRKVIRVAVVYAVVAWAAIEAGVETLDSSLGGLGGCPFAPNATGNIATEDLIFLLDRSGVTHGVDLDRAIECNHWFATVMGRELPSLVARAA